MCASASPLSGPPPPPLARLEGEGVVRGQVVGGRLAGLWPRHARRRWRAAGTDGRMCNPGTGRRRCAFSLLFTLRYSTTAESLGLATRRFLVSGETLSEDISRLTGAAWRLCSRPLLYDAETGRVQIPLATEEEEEAVVAVKEKSVSSSPRHYPRVFWRGGCGMAGAWRGGCGMAGAFVPRVRGNRRLGPARGGGSGPGPCEQRRREPRGFWG